MKFLSGLALVALVGCAPQSSVEKRDFCELGRIFYVGADDSLSRPLATEILANNRLFQSICGKKNG